MILLLLLAYIWHVSGGFCLADQFNKIYEMKSTIRRPMPPLLTIAQEQQMQHRELGYLGNNPFLSGELEELSGNCSEAAAEHEQAELDIKDKLKGYLCQPKCRGVKNQTRKHRVEMQTVDHEIRRKWESKIKGQLSMVFNQSGSQTVNTAREFRYRNVTSGKSSPLASSRNRPYTSLNTDRFPQPMSRIQTFSMQANRIIEQSSTRGRNWNKTKTKATKGFSQSPRNSNPRQMDPQTADKHEKYYIMNKVIESDINQIANHYKGDSKEFNPELQRQKYEERKRSQLTNLDRYSMSFVKFFKRKTATNRDKFVYNEKIRQKSTYIEKFQQYILDEYHFSGDTRHQLEKQFEKIEPQSRGL